MTGGFSKQSGSLHVRNDGGGAGAGELDYGGVMKMTVRVGREISQDVMWVRKDQWGSMCQAGGNEATEVPYVQTEG